MRMFTRSLLGQFILLHVATALIAALAVTVGASLLLHRTARDYQHDLLQQQTRTIIASQADGWRNDDILFDGMAFAILDAHHNTSVRHGPFPAGIIAQAPLEAKPSFFRTQAIRGLSTPFAGRWIVVTQDDESPQVITDDVVRTFLGRFALIGLLIAIGAPLIGALMTRRLTRRMRTISNAAAQIGPRSLNIRLPAEALPQEVAPIAAAMNQALDRLAEAFHKQASFAADVAHELRTPLAIIGVQIDALDDDATRSILKRSIDRLARVISQLLALADLEQRIEDMATEIDLLELAESVVSEQAAAIILAGRTIALEYEGERSGHHVRGYAVPLILALDNLIGNAAKYTPIGTTITVKVGPGTSLSVSDDGPGVTDADLERLKDRFWRGGDVQAEGMGLGLSIVQRVAEAHAGTLDVTRGQSAGLCFKLSLGEI